MMNYVTDSIQLGCDLYFAFHRYARRAVQRLALEKRQFVQRIKSN